MKRNYIELDTLGQYVLLYGFEELNDRTFVYYSVVPSNVIFTNNPQYSDHCYAIYAKRVNEDYALVEDDRLYTAIINSDLEYTVNILV
ncbi:MAG: hypothetical protein SPF99_06150 [Anaerobutyricum sp.]|nr:hypothetical protein [Anaerobutyricum sp.]